MATTADVDDSDPLVIASYVIADLVNGLSKFNDDNCSLSHEEELQKLAGLNIDDPALLSAHALVHLHVMRSDANDIMHRVHTANGEDYPWGEDLQYRQDDLGRLDITIAKLERYLEANKRVSWREYLGTRCAVL